jgi:hypothetical protein
MKTEPSASDYERPQRFRGLIGVARNANRATRRFH